MAHTVALRSVLFNLILVGFGIGTSHCNGTYEVAENRAVSSGSTIDPTGQTSESMDIEPDKEDSQVSDAERVAELNEAIDDARKQIQSLEQELENPANEYSVSEREFRQLNEQRELLLEALAKAKADSETKAEVLAEFESDLETLTTRWKLAKDRFDLAIEDRKTTKEQLVTLRHKLTRDEKALLVLVEGPEHNKDAGEVTQYSPDTMHRAHHGRDGDPEPKRATDRDSDKSHSSEDKNSVHSKSDEEEKDEELIRAEEAAAQKEAEVKEAQEETRSIEARLKDLQLLIAQEQKELSIARKKVDLATSTQHELSGELSRLQSEGADAEEISTIKSAIAQANQRSIQYRSEVTEISERLNDHRSELSNLQNEHIIALREAESKRQEALAMEQHVAALKNPFAVRNMIQWLIEHGPRVLLILLGMFVANRTASLLAFRSIQLVTKSSMRGSKVERENRARTLVGVFQNAASVGIFIAGTLMILEELGANITVLMGGVAVVGLAVAFGAQNLIKDYFYGFVMLLENQYMLNDTIRIGSVTGQVERITLRMTVLRDSSGVVHFIPNGTINSVSNETHGWSRAVCEVGINHQEDFDRVFVILNQVSVQLGEDPTIGPLLLEKPSEPAIENLGGPIIQLKLSVKTVPNKQSTVKQEWMRRIKTALAANGISPPYTYFSSEIRRWEEQTRRAA